MKGRAGTGMEGNVFKYKIVIEGDGFVSCKTDAEALSVYFRACEFYGHNKVHIEYIKNN